MKPKNKGFTVIEVLVLLAIVAVFLVLLSNLVGCTSDDQAKATSADTQTQEQTSGGTTSVDTGTSQVEVAQNDQPAEEEKPAEPETKTVTTYHFTSISERNTVDCDSEGKSEGCGATYSDCGPKRDETYACQTGVHEWSTNREELVKDN
jgi:prepilin-type N-terminal cleavage/methylation domain-containing protein